MTLQYSLKDDSSAKRAAGFYDMAIQQFEHGHAAQALDSIVRACAEPEALGSHHRTHAEILRRCGRSDEALAAAERATALDHDSAQVWETLGMIRLERNEFEQAAECYDRAVEIRPSFESFNNLAVALQQLGHLAAAEVHYLEALKLVSENSRTELSLAAVQGKLGRFQQALETVERVLVRGDSSVRAFLLASALEAHLGRYVPALEWVRQAQQFDPTKLETRIRKAEILLRLERFEAVLDEAQYVLGRSPTHARMLHIKALALQGANRVDDALRAFQCAENAGDALPVVTANRAWLLAEMGRKEDALAALDQALSLQPDLSIALYHKTYLSRRAIGGAELGAMEALADHPDTLDEDRMLLSFALGKANMDAGDHARAFARLSVGNRLKRSTIEYNHAAETVRFNQIKTAFCSANMNRLTGHGLRSEEPIFVFGMPRSGTTLIEQILSSHPLVHGAGETGYLRAAVDEAGVLSRMDKVTAEELVHLGQRYLDLVSREHFGRQRIVDKTTSNFELAGLISLSLPNARIIHCRRDPLDTCFSCYSLLFGKGNEYAYDQEELGVFYRLYDGLMGHWRRILPAGTFLEVDYESLVVNTESEVQRLLEFCGLPWEPNCLRFHETSRRVTSASLDQVRSPIYMSSIGRSGSFLPWLAPLNAALAG